MPLPTLQWEGIPMLMLVGLHERLLVQRAIWASPQHLIENSVTTAN